MNFFKHVLGYYSPTKHVWWLIFGLRLCGIITYDMTKNMKFDIEYFFKFCLAYPTFYEKNTFYSYLNQSVKYGPDLHKFDKY